MNKEAKELFLKTCTFRPNDKTHTLDDIDLSNINLDTSKFLGKITYPELWDDSTIICAWTDTVTWPKNMSQEFNPESLLEKSKKPYGMNELHNNNINGSGISIGIIDQTLAPHPEYNDALKRGVYEVIGNNWYGNLNGSYHGSLVSGCAVGKTTGSAPGANLYYIAANNWADTEQNLPINQLVHEIKAFERIIEINKNLPDNKKIRFLSCSFGLKDTVEDEKNKILNLITECKNQGIFVLMCTNEFLGSYDIIGCDPQYPVSSKRIGIPTNGKTTPYYKGGYIYHRLGGFSSTMPYIAGIFACACQNNQIFFTLPNWQNKLWNILKETAIEHEPGCKIINPVGIREQVSQIARKMEIILTNKEITK